MTDSAKKSTHTKLIDYLRPYAPPMKVDHIVVCTTLPEISERNEKSIYLTQNHDEDKVVAHFHNGAKWDTSTRTKAEFEKVAVVDFTKEEIYTKDLEEIASFFNCTTMSAAGICEGMTSTWLQAVLTDPIQGQENKPQEQKFNARLKFLLDYMTVEEHTPETLQKEIGDIYDSQKSSIAGYQLSLEEGGDKNKIIKLKQYIDPTDEKVKIKYSFNIIDKEGVAIEFSNVLKLDIGKVNLTTETIGSFKNKILAEISEQTRKTLTDTDLEKIEIRPFAETVFALHSPNKLGIFEGAVSQTQKSNVFPLTASVSLEKNEQYVHSNFLGVMGADIPGVANYFSEMEKLIKSDTSDKNQKVAFLLGSDNHTVGLYFDRSSSEWHFFDINFLKSNTTAESKYGYAYHPTSAAELAAYIFSSFSEKNEDPFATFSIRRLSTDGHDIALMQDMPKINEQEEPAAGKIYLSENGRFVFKDSSGTKQEGFLDKSDEIDLQNLTDRINDFEFKVRFLKAIDKHQISKTKLMSEEVLNEKISNLSNKISEKEKKGFFSTLREKVTGPKTLAINRTNLRGVSVLMKAIQSRQLESIKRIIDAGADVNAVNDNGIFPLMEAMIINNGAIVEILIGAGANVNSVDSGGMSPLMMAINSKNREMVDILVHKNLNPKNKIDVNLALKQTGHTPLMLAIELGDLEIINLILKAKPDLEKTNKEGKNVLMLAIEKGNSAMVELLIKADAKMDSKDKMNRTPLVLAVKKGNEGIFDLILNRVVNSKALDNKNKMEILNNALLEAAGSGNEAILKKLLSVSGIEVNRVTKVGYESLTPLNHAIKSGNIELVKILIKANANVNQEVEGAGTPLMVALTLPAVNKEIIETLLKASANVGAEFQGMTVLMLAQDIKNNDDKEYVINLLKTPQKTETEKSEPVVFTIGIPTGAINEAVIFSKSPKIEVPKKESKEVQPEAVVFSKGIPADKAVIITSGMPTGEPKKEPKIAQSKQVIFSEAPKKKEAPETKVVIHGPNTPKTPKSSG